MGEIDEGDMEESGTLDIMEKTITILVDIDDGHRWRNRKRVRLAKSFYVIHKSNVMSTRLLEVSNREQERCSVSKGMRGQWSID